MTTDSAVPEGIRAAAGSFGLCKDEFTESGGWPPALYQREVRRMVGDRVFTQLDVEAGVRSGADIGLASLGISAHAEDSHNMQRFACQNRNTPPCYGEGPARATGPFAWDEGDYHGVKQGSGVYQLPSYMVLPTAEQASNLLVVATPSASHVAFSTFRMEPAFMVLGNSVGIWAAMAAREPAGASRSVAPEALHNALLASGQVLRLPVAPAPPPSLPPAAKGYSCSVFGGRCVQLSDCRSGCTRNATCNGGCPGLGPAQWLAEQGSSGGFALQQHGGGTAAALMALSDKSWLKKSELHSSILPLALKRLVPRGQALAIDEHMPVSKDGYWLVTLSGGELGHKSDVTGLV